MKLSPLILALLGGAALYLITRPAGTGGLFAATIPGTLGKPNRLLPDQPQPGIPYVTAEGHAGTNNVAYLYTSGTGWQILPSAFDAMQGAFYQGSYNGDRAIIQTAQLIWQQINGDSTPQNAGFVWELIA